MLLRDTLSPRGPVSIQTRMRFYFCIHLSIFCYIERRIYDFQYQRREIEKLLTKFHLKRYE